MHSQALGVFNLPLFEILRITHGVMIARFVGAWGTQFGSGARG
jgi:hypothetical protein